MKKLRIVAIGSAVILLIGFTFRPIQNIDESQCTIAQGAVATVFEAGEKDIVFTLDNRSGSFYINRGMEQGFDLGALKDTIIGKPVKIWYVHKYSILTLLSSNKHISRLDIGSVTAFNELVEQE